MILTRFGQQDYVNRNHLKTWGKAGAMGRPRKRAVDIRTERISVRLPYDVVRQLMKVAEEQQRTTSWLVETFIKAGLGMGEPPPPLSIPTNGGALVKQH